MDNKASVLQQAIKYTLDYIEGFWGGCPKGTEELYSKYILSWYDNTDIREPRILSTLALKHGPCKILPCSKLEEAFKEFYLKEKGYKHNDYY